MPTLRKLISIVSLTVFLAVSFPAISHADPSGKEEGDDIAIVVDLAVLRPFGVVATFAGLVIFVGSLPISLATLSVTKTFNALVVNPARYTFVRKLGEDHLPE